MKLAAATGVAENMAPAAIALFGTVPANLWPRQKNICAVAVRRATAAAHAGVTNFVSEVMLCCEVCVSNIPPHAQQKDRLDSLWLVAVMPAVRRPVSTQVLTSNLLSSMVGLSNRVTTLANPVANFILGRLTVSESQVGLY